MPEYIEREMLKKRMFSYYDCVNENTGKSNYNGETLMNYEVADMIEDCIDNAPTANVVPMAEAVKSFAHFLIDRTEGDSLDRGNIVDLAIEFLGSKNEKL